MQSKHFTLCTHWERWVCKHSYINAWQTTNNECTYIFVCMLQMLQCITLMLNGGRSIAHYNVHESFCLGFSISWFARCVRFFVCVLFCFCEMPQVTALLCIHYSKKRLLCCSLFHLVRIVWLIWLLLFAHTCTSTII